MRGTAEMTTDREQQFSSEPDPYNNSSPIPE
jgi:hypothetical protein